MASATGWIRVETDIDLADYDGEYDIEFYGIEDIIDTADANNYTKEEIVDWCFENGLDIEDYLKTSVTYQTLLKILNRVLEEKFNYMQAMLHTKTDSLKDKDEIIRDLRAKIDSPEDTMTDEEALKNVAY